MSARKWIGCGESYPRLELYGTLSVDAEIERAANATQESISSFSGLRIAVKEVPETEDVSSPSYFNLMRVHEVTFPVPVPLDTSGKFIFSIPDASLGAFVFEGLENPLQRLLNLVTVSGWKLVFRKGNDGGLFYDFIQRSDWELNALPSLLPGFSEGEVLIHGKVGKAVDYDKPLGIEVTWPFTLSNRLKLQKPAWTGSRWRANLDFATFDKLLDGAGDLLRDFPFGKIDIPGAIKQAGDTIDDFLFLEAGTEPVPLLPPAEDGDTGEEGENEEEVEETEAIEEGPPPETEYRDYFEIEVSTQEATEIASFAGLKLWLMGRVALSMKAAFEKKFMELEFRLKFGAVSEIEYDEQGNPENDVGLKLTGGFITQLEAMGNSIREVASLLPIPGVDKLPDIAFRYDFDFLTASEFLDENYSLSLGKLRIPTWPDLLPEQMPSIGFLKNIPLSIPEGILENLKDFRIGSLDGDSPAMEMIILEAANHVNGAVIGLDLTIRIGFKLFGETLHLKCKWLMTFHKENLAFSPAANVLVEVDLDKPYLDFKGLRIEGLDTLKAKWDSAGIELSAKNLRAYYVGISAPGDTSKGFEFIVHNFLLDSGGLDLDASIVGGSSKVNGIGDSFKAVSGNISIARSHLNSAEIKTEGPIPWMDNATGTLAIIFGSNFSLREVNANFQLGIHKKTDWWVELDLKSLKVDLDFSGSLPSLLMKLTGKIALKPPPDSGGTFLSFLDSAELEFNDLVITKMFDGLPPGINLIITLSKPLKKDIFGVFGFELRSIGIGSGFEPGEAALLLGGQVFFSGGDLVSTEMDFHMLKIGTPRPGEFFPRISLERLGLNFSVASTVKLSGSLSLKDTATYKGFIGEGKLVIADKIGIQVILEFSKVKRERDGIELRVWMVYMDIEEVNIPLVHGFYLRDVGVGFGWRKTLRIMDNPMLLLDYGSKSYMSLGPHKPEAWVNDLEGDDARWTVVLASWLTFALAPRNSPSIIAGDIIIGIRSDLTFLVSFRGWIFGVLEKLKNGSTGGKPAIQGLLYYSPRNEHLLAMYRVDPSAVRPEGVPTSIAQAVSLKPFSFLLETKPGLFRIELGWPKQLTFPVGLYTGRVGILLRKTPGSLVIGVAFELSIDKQLYIGFYFGIGSLSIFIQLYIGIYGVILMRIGDRAALYGVVGINVLVIISIYLSISFKIGWFRISFSIGFSIIIVINARVDFGISEAGFGMAGYAYASLSIWKFSVSAQVSFVINQGALNEAYARVTEGTSGLPDLSGLGDDEVKLRPIPLLPDGILPVPDLPPQNCSWRTFFIQRDEVINHTTSTYVYVMLLPEKDSWFANPQINPQPVPKPDEIISESAVFSPPSSDKPDYAFDFTLENLEPDFLSPQAVPTRNGNSLKISQSVNWNAEIPGPTNSKQHEATTQKKYLGSLFYEPEPIKEEYRIIENLIVSRQPELIIDERVRAEDPGEEMPLNCGNRNDVRSPKFSESNSLYDAVNEIAFKNGKDELLSWQQVALAYYTWTDEVFEKKEIIDYLFTEDKKPGIKPSEKAALDHWRKSLLDAGEMIRGNRAGVIARLIQEFRDWAYGVSIESLPLLKHAGVAFRFKVGDKQKPYSLSINKLSAFQGFNKGGLKVFHELDKNSIIHHHISEKDNGLGFARKEFDYKIKDIIEFQDTEGIHFSWKLECRDAENNISEMTEHDLSNVGTPVQLRNRDKFEYFDHFLIERINLSNNETDNTVLRREVKPGFVPALADMGGDAEKKFFLVAPRFSYSDPLSPPKEKKETKETFQAVKTGDELLYRVMAVDIFGNHSQVTELITSRKNLEIPPAPEKGLVYYEAELSDSPEPVEHITLSVLEAKEKETWQGGDLIYEFWSRSYPISAGGFFGMNDAVNTSDAHKGDSPVLTPKGMVLVGLIKNDLFMTLSDDVVKNISRGKAFEFYLRAVSKDGNASRLVRSEVTTKIKKAGTMVDKEFKQPYLERVPGPSLKAYSWLTMEEVRTEVLTAEYPVFSGNAEDPLFYKTALDPSEREVYFRILHRRFADAAEVYLTGGYELFVRDRDNTIDDTPANYQKVGQLETVSSEVYLSTPPNSEMDNKWESHFLSTDEISAEEFFKNKNSKLYLNWGEPVSPYEGSEKNGIPSGTLIHHRLFELVTGLKEYCEAEKLELHILGGLPTPKAFENMSFEKLIERFNEDEDPYGTCFLKWMGRLTDISIRGANGFITAKDLYETVNDIVRSSENSNLWDQYTVNIELMINGDKATPMSFFRLSLAPVIKSAAENLPDTGITELLAAEFENFKRILLKLPYLKNFERVPGSDGKDNEYNAFIQKYHKNFSISGQGNIKMSMSHFLDQGDYIRPVKKDNTILFHLAYKEDYARRYSFRIKRVSRYNLLYETFGFMSSENAWQNFNGDSLAVRFPRVKPPAKPSAKFLGDAMETHSGEDKVLYSEWFVAEHDEEPMVRANETMRNRLGFRGVAWSLFVTTLPGFEEGSGWKGRNNWLARNVTLDSAEPPGLSQEEKEILAANATWKDESGLAPLAGLINHPFTELLGPKGMFIRIPKLPYYYRYRLGAFSRTDDVDSDVNMVDAAPVMPSMAPVLDTNAAGWRLEGNKLSIWWKVPSVWDSLDKTEKKMWKNEGPFASRLWDFDLRYTISVDRNMCNIPQVEVKAMPWEGPSSLEDPPLRRFEALAPARDLYFISEKKIEKIDMLTFKSPFDPVLKLELKVSEQLMKIMQNEENFEFTFKCYRTYGTQRVRTIKLRRK